MLPARSRLICMDLSHPLCSLHSGERRLKLGRASSQRECGRNCNLLLKDTCQAKGNELSRKQEGIQASCDGATHGIAEETGIKQGWFSSEKVFEAETICSVIIVC